MSLWLAASAGPPAEDVAERVAFWREREASLHAAGVGLEPGPERPQAQGQVDTFLPLSTLRRDAVALLEAWFGPELDALRVDLTTGALEQARSVLDLRAWLPGFELPAAWLEGIGGDVERAHAALFALFAPRRMGSALGRYPERLDALAQRAPHGDPLRVWDAGCGTGEGTWELAVRLSEGRAVEAVGTTPWPLERLMAERRGRPHDPSASEPLRRLAAAAPDRCRVRFQGGDLGEGPPAGTFHVVTCHGLLGGLIDDVDGAMRHLVAALEPDAVLSVTDRFREDLAQSARERVAAVAKDLGLAELETGLFRHPGRG